MTNEKYYTAEKDLAASYDLNYNMIINGDNNNVSTNIYGDTAKISGGSYDANANPEVSTVDVTESVSETTSVGNFQNNVFRAGFSAATFNGFAGSNFADFGFGGQAKRYLYSQWESFSHISNFSSTRGDSFSFGKDLAGISRDNGVMTFSATDGTNLTVETQDSTDQAVNVDLGGQRYIAKIGETNKENSQTYANGVNYYMGGSFYDEIKIFSGYGETSSINLNTQSSSIEAVNAAFSTSNNVIIGKDFEGNTFWGGAGFNAMFGGYFSNDTFFSGTGTSEVYFGKNSGSDAVLQSKETDRYNLYDVTIEDISFIGQTASGFELDLKDGSKLSLDGNINRTFVLQQQEYTYHAESASWTSTQVTTA